ncbi:aspartate--tRNA ligase [Candidatus Parcubacteria bacterium]|nr:aspartate--tRNA ligase [Candidatus Parcubacteria bacterium]
MARLWTSETPKHVGKTVELVGWVANRRDHGKLIFLDFRDRSGVVQAVVSPENAEVHAAADKLRSEWVIALEGEVRARPEKMVNPAISTGSIEVAATAIRVLSESSTPPFPLDTVGYDIGEDNRMKYRYLDLRRERMKRNLLLRHEVTLFMRNWLAKRGFVEVETPILTKSTPEGARDYVVPSRLQAGKFYALPQSPQQYKQLLMVAGLERYFQIARCFRDEDTRGDRQPEFTQLDIEMSFVTQEEILQLVEELYVELVKVVTPQHHIAQIPFPRLSYEEAMAKYQSEKPDLRTDKTDKNELAFAFIVDFPMFEWKETEERWDAVHHPFTKVQSSKFKVQSSQEEFIEYIKQSPGELIAQQYDFVLNGFEIGGGSIREHSPKILEAVFEVLGHTREEIHAKFGHLLEAFSYGVPPHGGIAPGIDRLVMVLAGEENIREVIAFPKTGDGRDLMMNAPAEISAEQLHELHLEVLGEGRKSGELKKSK